MGTASLREVIGCLEQFAPPGLAESWDRSGLQVGDPGSEIRAILVALDPSPAALLQAQTRNANLIVTHHPLLLKPLKCIDLSQPRGRLVAGLLREGVALYTAHTNLDKAAGGVNDRFADALGLGELAPLCPGEPLKKVVVTVPAAQQEQVREAMCAAGAGRIGNYDSCTFAAAGTGSFRPLEGAAPFTGEVGRLERLDEIRLEAVVSADRVGAVKSAILSAHPYEAVALDVYPLELNSEDGALGRVGRLAMPTNLTTFARRVREALDAPGVRFVGAPDRPIERVAVCGGSGADLWPVARGRGADVLVTGDVKYHTALDVLDAGFSIIDAGHGATEGVSVALLAQIIQEGIGNIGADLPVHLHEQTEPFHWAVAE